MKNNKNKRNIIRFVSEVSHKLLPETHKHKKKAECSVLFGKLLRAMALKTASRIALWNSSWN